MVDSDLCSVVESCGDVLGLVLVNRHLVRLPDASLEWMWIVELATDCKRVYIHSCCLEDSSSVVIERVAPIIV
jgi:hypothetical protein